MTRRIISLSGSLGAAMAVAALAGAAGQSAPLPQRYQPMSSPPSPYGKGKKNHKRKLQEKARKVSKGPKRKAKGRPPKVRP